MQHAVAWQGYIIAAQLVDPTGATRNAASVYLPPGGGAEAAAHLDALPDWEGPWLAAGDLNVDVAEPRNATDLAGAERAGRWAERRGLVAVGTGRPTLHLEDGSEPAVDWAFVPAYEPPDTT